jgi:hypothetical protein
MVNIIKFTNSKKPVFVQALKPDFVELSTDKIDSFGNTVKEVVELFPTLWEMNGVFYKAVSFSQSPKGYLTLKVVEMSAHKSYFVGQMYRSKTSKHDPTQDMYLDKPIAPDPSEDVFVV